MAEEEFQESDVIFADHNYQNPCHADDGGCSEDRREVIVPAQHNSMAVIPSRKSKKSMKQKKTVNSTPVNIPKSVFRCTDLDDELEEEWEDEGMVPPHVIIGQRIARKMAFLVCTGNGRALKGRDLSQVRNSILRMTGFLET